MVLVWVVSVVCSSAVFAADCVVVDVASCVFVDGWSIDFVAWVHVETDLLRHCSRRSKECGFSLVLGFVSVWPLDLCRVLYVDLPVRVPVEQSRRCCRHVD